MKKIRMISIFLCLTVLFSMFPVFAFSGETASPFANKCSECGDSTHGRNWYTGYATLNHEQHYRIRENYRECDSCGHLEWLSTSYIPEDHSYPCRLCGARY